MLEFIHQDFKLDLTYLKPTYNEENIWFKTDIESDYSFPFEIPYLEWVKISNINEYNSVDKRGVFFGMLNQDGVVQDARLTVNEIQGKKITATLMVGFEGLTSFDVKLSELGLAKFPVENLKNHALDCITKSYPDVDYNFGLVHTAKYDAKSDEFYGFEGAINNYRSGFFIDNILEPDTNLDMIRNIMQPLPYLLYLLKKGFEYDGKILAGDVLNIPELQRGLVFCDNSYFDAASKESLLFQVGVRDFKELDKVVNLTHNVSANVYKYTHEVTITKRGDYLLFGQIYLVWHYYASLTGFFYLTPVNCVVKRIRYGQETILKSYFRKSPIEGAYFDSYKTTSTEFLLDDEYTFEVGDRIVFEKLEVDRIAGINDTIDSNPYVCDFKLIPIRYLEQNGTPILSVKDKNEIDLSLCVPDMTFKTLVEQVMKLKKLDLSIENNMVYMNRVVDKISARQNAIDLSKTEIEDPLLSITSGKSYELKFTDAESNDTYKYDSIYVDKSGIKTNIYNASKDTTPITLDVLPLPESIVGGVKSCFAFSDEKNKLRLVSFIPIPFTGNDSQVPITFQDYKFLMPYIYETDYKKWFDFSIKSTSYQWENIVSVEQMSRVFVNSISYAYSNYHVLKEIEKERINEMWWKVSFKTESID